ncbi:MAG: branched-chain amino acid ABC transporter substrate-binding protein, partial [Betaproteobacteria bacterium]|nr:branched-chain amino acid ABC transporter substrate-binding protein [Betaproteobacteria bacterium]
MAASLLLGFASQQVLAQETVVRLGHVAPTSGSIAHLGKDNENGARLA